MAACRYHLLVIILLLAFLAPVLFATNATAAYRSSTGNGVNYPKIREWNSAGSGSWGAEVELATAGSPVREAVIRYSNVSPKRVIVTQGDDGQLDAYVSFNGNEWQATNDIGRVWTSAPGTHSRRFDVEFETATGDAIVIYSVESANASCDLAYKLLPANQSNFTGVSEQCIDDTTIGTDVQYSWVRLARKPGASSEEILAIGFDSTGNDVSAWVWGGSSWGNQQELSTSSTATGGYGAIAVAYAADGSKGMAVAGSGTAGNVATYYWSGGAWTDSADFTGPSNNRDVRWLNLKADPSTDDMTVVFLDSTSRFGTAYWGGAAWTVLQNRDGGATIDSSTTRPVDFAWDPTGSTGRLVFDTDTTGTNLRTIACSPQCTGTAANFATYAGTGAWITMLTNPTAADTLNILGLRLNSNNDIGSFSWNGTTHSNYGDGALTSDTTVATYEAYGADFQRAFDTRAPTYSNQAQSQDNVSAGGTNYLSVQLADNVQLHTAILETNETGTFQNKSGVYSSPIRMYGNYSPVNFSWSNASTPGGTTVAWRVWANDTSGNWNSTSLLSFLVPAVYNFTASPSLDNFSVVNDTYKDRNYTLNNTGNQALSIVCGADASWGTNITACPSSLAAGASQNVTFRFNATGQPIGNTQVTLYFNSTNVNRTATANVTVTGVPVYNFTVSPSTENFSVANNAYMDRNYTLNNTGNQELSIGCSSNYPAQVANITACPVALSPGATSVVTFRFNATGVALGNYTVYLNFSDPSIEDIATVYVEVTSAVYNFTVSPSPDSFTLPNNTYVDREYLLNNTGNQQLAIECTSPPSQVNSTTETPVVINPGETHIVTFRFNGTGVALGNYTIYLNFSDPNLEHIVTVYVEVAAASPIIMAYLIDPISATSTDPSTPFNQTCNVTCSSLQCDSVGIYAQYSNDSGANYYEMSVSTQLNTSTVQPQSCGNMSVDSWCNRTWIVAGKTPGTYKIRCWANSTNAPESSSATPSFDVTANIFVETSISPASVLFGSFDPGTSDNAASNNPINITVTSNTNVNIDTYIGATDLTNASNVIEAGNMSVSKTSGGARTALTNSFPGTPYYQNIAPNSVEQYFFYLTIPAAQNAGDYASTVTIKTVQTGVAP